MNWMCVLCFFQSKLCRNYVSVIGVKTDHKKHSSPHLTETQKNIHPLYQRNQQVHTLYTKNKFAPSPVKAKKKVFKPMRSRAVKPIAETPTADCDFRKVSRRSKIKNTAVLIFTYSGITDQLLRSNWSTTYSITLLT